VGFIEHVYTLRLVQFVPLIKFVVAAKAQGGNPVVMGFDRPPFTVPELVAVRRHHRAVLCPAVLARATPHGF